MKKKIRWGICGCGYISGLFAAEMAYTKHCSLQAVASRSIKKAKAFAKEHGVVSAYGSYHQLLDDPLVDVVYVAIPHPYHMKNTLQAIDAGKAVLCEKPFAMNVKQARKMVTAARKKKVFLMEGM